jgi:hypothetical protein
VLLNKSGAPRTFHLDFSHTALVGTQSLNPLWNTKDQVSVSHNAADVNVGANQLEIMEVQR